VSKPDKLIVIFITESFNMSQTVEQPNTIVEAGNEEPSIRKVFLLPNESFEFPGTYQFKFDGVDSNNLHQAKFRILKGESMESYTVSSLTGYTEFRSPPSLNKIHFFIKFDPNTNRLVIISLKIENMNSDATLPLATKVDTDKLRVYLES